MITQCDLRFYGTYFELNELKKGNYLSLYRIFYIFKIDSIILMNYVNFKFDGTEK